MRRFLLGLLLLLCGVSTFAQAPSSFPYSKPIPNDPATGTTQFTLTKINASGNAVIMATTDTTGYTGVCVANCGTTGSAWIAFAGLVPLKVDGTTTLQHYIKISPTVGGDGTDSGAATYPTGSTDVIGRVQLASTGSGSFSMVDIDPESVAGPTIPTASVLGGSAGALTVATAHGVVGPLQCSDTSGSATAQSCTTNPSFTPALGDMIVYYTTTQNSGALTLNVNSTSAAPVQKWQGTALSSGDNKANKPIPMTFDGTNWQITVIGNPPGGVTSVSAPVQFTVNNPTTNATLVWSDPNLAADVDVFAPFFAWPNSRVFRYITTNVSGSFNAMGENTTEAGATQCGTGAGATVASNSAPAMCQDTTGTTANTPAGIAASAGSSSAMHRTGRTHGIVGQMSGSVSSVAANIRYFRGYSDQSAATMVGADVPAGNFVGVMYSSTGTYTGLTDTTHFVCLTKDNTTEFAQSSGITADNAYHTFGFWEDVSNSRWKIYIDGALVCTNSSNIPTSGTNLRYINQVQNLSTNNLTIATAWTATIDDK